MARLTQISDENASPAAVEILGEIKSPKYGKQIKEAIQLIASAKQWYDSNVVREAVK